MSQERLFYEDLNDVLDAVIKCLGGYEKVAMDLWPSKPLRTGYARLKACVNPDKDEKLALEEFLLLLKWARAKGCHMGMAFVNEDCGYVPPEPKDPLAEKAELQALFMESVKMQAQVAQNQEAIIKRMEKLQGKIK